MKTSDQPKLGENIALEESVTVRTRYVGQHLRVVLERQVEEHPYGDTDTTTIKHVRQAELVIEAGTRVTIGHAGVRIEALPDES